MILELFSSFNSIHQNAKFTELDIETMLTDNKIFFF